MYYDLSFKLSCLGSFNEGSQDTFDGAGNRVSKQKDFSISDPLHSERPKLYTILAFLSAIRKKKAAAIQYSAHKCCCLYFITVENKCYLCKENKCYLLFFTRYKNSIYWDT